MKKGLILYLFLSVCIPGISAQAQGNRNINQTIHSKLFSTEISPTIILSSSSSLSLPNFTNSTDVENGLESSPINVMVVSNVNWKLTTEIGVITFMRNTDSPALINSPLTFANFAYASTRANDLFYGSFIPFNIASQAVTKVGPLGNETTPQNTFNLKFKITPGNQVDPAAYTVPVIMTLSNQ